MQSSLWALWGYILWTLLLLLSIGVQRSMLTLSGRRHANSFSTTGEDISPFAQRLCRAHANCYESFPIFGGLLLLALATGNAAITDPLAGLFLAARIAQSLTHLISTSRFAVLIRFAFFIVQIVIAIIWLYRLAQWMTA